MSLIKLGTIDISLIKEIQEYSDVNLDWKCGYNKQTKETILFIDESKYTMSIFEKPEKITHITENGWLFKVHDEYFYAWIEDKKLKLVGNFQEFSLTEKGLYYFKQKDFFLRFLDFQSGKITVILQEKCDYITFFYGYILVHTNKTQIYINRENPPSNVDHDFLVCLNDSKYSKQIKSLINLK